MPNHIQNRLTIIGSDEQVKEVLTAIAGVYDDGQPMQIDFNKITPMPKELNITSDGWLMSLENKFSSQDRFKAKLDELKNHLSNNPDRKEDITANFLQGIKNYLEHGHATWYNWSLENWGTKWNAYGQSDKRNTDNVIYFQTAWSSPINLIEKLSSQYPEITFQLDYADEDSSSNTGKITFISGLQVNIDQPKSLSKEGYDIYFDLHPNCKDDYELKDGTYHYKEED